MGALGVLIIVSDSEKACFSAPAYKASTLDWPDTLTGAMAEETAGRYDRMDPLAQTGAAARSTSDRRTFPEP